jgi:type I restriction enzyme R subunit
LILALRYKELFVGGGGGGGPDDVPYEIDGYLTEIDTGKIDADYMNTRFDKYLKMLGQPGIDQDQLQQTLDEVHKSFAYLTQEEQKYANIFLNDVQRGDADLSAGLTFRDHITKYRANAKDEQIKALIRTFGLAESTLRSLLNSGVTEANLNQYGRFDALKESVDKAKAKKFF